MGEGGTPHPLRFSHMASPANRILVFSQAAMGLVSVSKNSSRHPGKKLEYLQGGVPQPKPTWLATTLGRSSAHPHVRIYSPSCGRGLEGCAGGPAKSSARNSRPLGSGLANWTRSIVHVRAVRIGVVAVARHEEGARLRDSKAYPRPRQRAVKGFWVGIFPGFRQLVYTY